MLSAAFDKKEDDIVTIGPVIADWHAEYGRGLVL